MPPAPLRSSGTGGVFLASALAPEGVVSRERFAQWLQSRREANQFSVERVPFSELRGWHFEEETGDLAHQSGKFFRIEGISVETNFGPTTHWMQPIINQPEIGILGFLTQRIDGVLHFLAQAKMEPGNVNTLQLSPTVQATRSNYTQVHGGSRPRYLDYFLDRSRARVLVDQLQSEQGARFLRKRNRNMIVEVPEGEAVDVHPDFCWLTLGQLHDLLRVDNMVNMDSRTVLSCIRYADEWPAPLTPRPPLPRCGERGSLSHGRDTAFHEAILTSALAGDHEAANDFDHIVSWLTDLKVGYSLNVRRVPLKETEGWERDAWEIRHASRRFFRVVGVAVRASNREVQSWEQPLVDSREGGVLCFVCQRHKGMLHFLVQGRVEPGNLDGVEMAPTLQCTPANYDPAFPERYPPFYHLVMNAPPEAIRYTSIQSEEGGRFYHDENRYLVVEIGEDQDPDLPANYLWMTLRQMKEFIRFNNYLNIEARGLLACLG